MCVCVCEREREINAVLKHKVSRIARRRGRRLHLLLIPQQLPRSSETVNRSIVERLTLRPPPQQFDVDVGHLSSQVAAAVARRHHASLAHRRLRHHVLPAVVKQTPVAGGRAVPARPGPGRRPSPQPRRLTLPGTPSSPGSRPARITAENPP